jgi:hypothetical protein
VRVNVSVYRCMCVCVCESPFFYISEF